MDAKVRPLRSEGRFKKIMGDKWSRLHPDIQRRFDKNPVPGQPLKYEGVLKGLTCSFWGKVFVQAGMFSEVKA